MSERKSMLHSFNLLFLSLIANSKESIFQFRALREDLRCIFGFFIALSWLRIQRDSLQYQWMFLLLVLSLSILPIFLLNNRSRGGKHTEYHHVIFNDYLFILIGGDRFDDLRLTLVHSLSNQLLRRLLFLLFRAALLVERDHRIIVFQLLYFLLMFLDLPH